VSQKIPTFKLSLTLSRKGMKFATKLYNITHLTLGTLLHYPAKLKIQMFYIYSADMQQNANKFVHKF